MVVAMAQAGQEIRIEAGAALGAGGPDGGAGLAQLSTVGISGGGRFQG